MDSNVFITTATIAKANLKYYRISAIIVGTGILLGYPVFRYFSPEMYDPFLLRVVVGLPFLLIAGVSHFIDFFEKRFPLFFNACLTIVLFWLLYLAGKNDFSFVTTTLFLIVSAINTTALGKSKFLPAYSLFVLVITISYFYFSGIEKSLGFTIILSILLVHFIVYMVLRSKEDTENSLKESESKIKHLVRALGEGIGIIDKNDKFLFTNPTANDLFEVDAEHLLGHSIIDFLSDKDKEIFLNRPALKNENAFNSFELNITTNSGKRKTLLVTETAYNLKQLVIDGNILVFRDITDRKNKEKELQRAKAKAEESDRLKSAFLANMSHEIRTPMNSILGFTELLSTVELSTTVQQEYFAIIKHSGNRLINIINDIMDISKIEAGIIDVRISEFDVNERIDHIYKLFYPEAAGKGIDLKKSTNFNDVITLIKTDKEKFLAVLTNLVKNAIKFTNSGQIIFGYTYDEKLSPGQLVFFVEDTGIGVSNDRIEAIFDRFVQADIDNQRAYQGSGLGLSITKAYVELLGGDIWVESEEGKGSTFYFSLPFDKSASPTSQVKEDASYFSNEGIKKANVSGYRILIVEDDPHSEKFLVEVLSKKENEILIASNGLEAINLCRKHPELDLILMDIKLPGLSGIDCTKQIRGFNKKVVIIAQSAFVLSNDKEKAIEAGCNDYITKPIDKNMLYKLIEKYLQPQSEIHK